MKDKAPKTIASNYSWKPRRETPEISDELREQNSKVYHYVIGSGGFQDCTVCQTEEGRGVVGYHTRKDIPVDIRVCLVVCLPTKPEEEELVFKSYVCTDCLAKAKALGVNVLDGRHEWKPEGFFLRSDMSSFRNSLNDLYENTN